MQLMRNSVTIVLVLLLATSAFSFRSNVFSPDLSTPEKSFEAFVHALKIEGNKALATVATRTGLSSLMALAENGEYQSGKVDLAKDLSAADIQWDKITDDIYMVAARISGKIHKLEFTLEEPGWMLYHWQLGGGVEH